MKYFILTNPTAPLVSPRTMATVKYFLQGYEAALDGQMILDEDTLSFELSDSNDQRWLDSHVDAIESVLIKITDIDLVVAEDRS